jgi:hypothetical protein
MLFRTTRQKSEVARFNIFVAYEVGSNLISFIVLPFAISREDAIIKMNAYAKLTGMLVVILSIFGP